MPSAYNFEVERLRLIRLLHVAKRDLRMEDADYRAVLSQVSNGAHDSAKDLCILELKAAIKHMKRCGFKVRTKGSTRPDKPTPPRRQADDPEARKIRALWLLLHALGAVNNPSEVALAAYVKRLTKVDDLHWINGLQAETLIETLKKWALRFLPAEVDRLAPLVKELPLSDDDRFSVAYHLHLARTRGTFDPMQGAYQALNDALKRAAS